MKDDAAEAIAPGDTAEQVLGRRIAELRRHRQWSQEELALRMKTAGFPWRQTTVAKTEKADRPVRVNEAAALAQMFEVPVEQLVTMDRPELLVRYEEAKQAYLRWSSEVTAAEIQADYAKLRYDAIGKLITFWASPTKDDLIAAVPAILDTCHDAQELLVAAGIPKRTLANINKRVSERRISQIGHDDEGEETSHGLVVRLVSEGLLEWFTSSRNGTGDG